MQLPTWTSQISSGEKSGKTKIKLFDYNGKRYVWRNKDEAFKPKNSVPIVQHGGGSIMLWRCFACTGTPHKVNAMVKKD